MNKTSVARFVRFETAAQALAETRHADTTAVGYPQLEMFQ